MQTINFIAVFFLITQARKVISQEEYCGMYGCMGRPHVGCIKPGFGRDCPKEVEILNMAPLRDGILWKHNFFRNIAASGFSHPAAARMATVRWCWELERLALIKSKQCNDEVYCTSTEYFSYAGQCISNYRSDNRQETNFTLNSILDTWFSEKIVTTAEEIKSYPAHPTRSIRRFGITANDHSNYVGCAAVRFFKPEPEPFHNLLLTCNYASMNFVGENIYEISTKPGSGCKRGKNKSPYMQHLCDPLEFYDNRTLKPKSRPTLN